MRILVNTGDTGGEDISSLEVAERDEGDSLYSARPHSVDRGDRGARCSAEHSRGGIRALEELGRSGSHARPVVLVLNDERIVDRDSCLTERGTEPGESRAVRRIRGLLADERNATVPERDELLGHLSCSAEIVDHDRIDPLTGTIRRDDGESTPVDLKLFRSHGDGGNNEPAQLMPREALQLVPLASGIETCAGEHDAHVASESEIFDDADEGGEERVGDGIDHHTDHVVTAGLQRARCAVGYEPEFVDRGEDPFASLVANARFAVGDSRDCLDADARAGGDVRDARARLATDSARCARLCRSFSVHGIRLRHRCHTLSARDVLPPSSIYCGDSDNVVKSSEEKVVQMTFIVVAGAAGAGKSTLGRAIARKLALPILDLDTMTNPVLDDALNLYLGGTHWNDQGLRGTIRPARYRALRDTIADQAEVGGGAVAVAPFTAELAGGADWHDLVVACQGEPVVVWITGTQELLARRRAHREVDRDAHAIDVSPTPPRVPHLRLDAALSTPQQLTRVLRHIGALRSVPLDSPTLTRRYEAGLFDLDGTLIDSTPAVLRSWNRLSAEYGVDINPLASGHGQPATHLVRAIFSADRAEAALARITEIEAAEVSDVVPIPGSAEFFTSVPVRAIVTSGTRLIAGNRLVAAGISRPDTLVTFDDVTQGKPNPEPFLLAAQQLGVRPEACVVFEDAPAGITAGKAAGCTVVAITGTHDADELQDADLVVDRLDQLTVVNDQEGFRLALSA